MKTKEFIVQRVTGEEAMKHTEVSFSHKLTTQFLKGALEECSRVAKCFHVEQQQNELAVSVLQSEQIVLRTVKIKIIVS
jgi:hypothetical protein